MRSSNQWSLATVIAPAVEPITLAEAKTHLRVTFTDDDAYITGLISVARASVEEYLSRALISRTYDLTIDEFPYDSDYIVLPRAPVSSITSVKYFDDDNVQQTVVSTDYELNDGRLMPVETATWPTIYDKLGSVVVRYVAGYGATSASVPPDILHAVKLSLSHWYENREVVVIGSTVNKLPMTVEFLLNPHRIWWAGIYDSRR